MKLPLVTLPLAAAIAGLSQVPALAEGIAIEHGYLTATIGGEANEPAFRIHTSGFPDGEAAARALQAIYDQWPKDQKPPTLVLDVKTKSPGPKVEALRQTALMLSKRADLRVIFLPAPRGAIPDSWTTATKILEEHATSAKP